MKRASVLDRISDTFAVASISVAIGGWKSDRPALYAVAAGLFAAALIVQVLSDRWFPDAPHN